MSVAVDVAARKRAALLGAIVADAASLGLHWLYDPAYAQTLRSRASPGSGLEFVAPDAANFDGRPGYFAHGGKKIGDLTHYGAHLLTAIDTVAQGKGRWSTPRFAANFATTFGPGGSWVGYIDGATSATLQNLKADSEKVIADAVGAAGLEGNPRTYASKYIPKKAAEFSGEKLQDEIAGVIATVFGSEANLSELQAKARTAAKLYEQNLSKAPGADDNQISAFVKLPAVVAAIAESNDADFARDVEAAVRVTNNNNDAVAYSIYAAKVVQLVLLGEAVQAALVKALATVGDKPDVKSAIEKALTPEAAKLSAAELASTFGMPCPLVNAVPLSVAILNRPSISYSEAVRINIEACGDNAGRAVFIGAVLGASSGVATSAGVPLSWIAKLQNVAALASAIDAAVVNV